jgi:hypothetical protein
MPRNTENPKKVGRDEVTTPEKLLDRYEALKQFLESNWGRIGLELRRVRRPEDVRKVLTNVPGIEYSRPFREQSAVCLIEAGTTEVAPIELRRTREAHDAADSTESRLWSEYHHSRQKAEEATNILKIAIADYGSAIGFFPFFLVVVLIAQELSVEELTRESNRVEASLRLAQRNKQRLKEQITCQQAWYAQSEVVRFARNRRYDKTAENFAKAMAGLPEYTWLYSLRKCLRFQNESAPSTSLDYRLFQLIRVVVQRVKRLDLTKIEISVQKELLRQDSDLMLQAYVSPNWAYMKQAFAQCRGKRFRRAELPYKIMTKFHANVDRLKTSVEAEIAKRNQLLSH